MTLRWAAYGPFNEQTAANAVRSVAREAGIDVAGLELIRMGENAVFRSRSDVVFRVARAHTDRDGLQHLVDVARWLADEDFPAARVLDVEQPLRAGGLAVTFWRSLGHHPTYGSSESVGQLLRRLHDLTAPSQLHLPDLDPFTVPERQLGVLPISEPDRTFLLTRLARLRETWSGMSLELPAGPVHGDASMYNVLLDRHGTPTLIDLDDFAVGPREWDLLQTAMFHERFGWHTDEDYRAFVTAYGHDVLSWPGYPVMAGVREIHMIAWLAQQADQSEQIANEVSVRIESLRTESSRRSWQPY